MELEAGRAYYLGRRATNDVQVDSPSVAKVHAVVSLMPQTPTRLSVCDLASTNGTQVRGENAPVGFLAPGETLSIARVATLRFESEGDCSFWDELRETLEAAPGSFLAEVHAGRWDRPKFRAFGISLRTACERSASWSRVPRWLADGFHHVGAALPSTISPGLRRAVPADHLESALEHLRLLSSWFFSGECPMTDPVDLARELDDIARE